MSIDVLTKPAVIPITPDSSRTSDDSTGDELTEVLGLRWRSIPDSSRFLISGVSWSTYEELLIRRDSERPNAKIVYHRGALELMTVSNPHERWKKMIARLIETLSLALRIPISASGNISLRRRDVAGGFEPDESYYVLNAGTMNTIRDIDFEVDPPPDLAIEVELSRSVLNRLEICRGIGIPELWRFEGGKLTFLGLIETGYETLTESRAFPGLSPADFQRFLLRTGTADDTTLCLEFFDWVRSNLSASKG